MFNLKNGNSKLILFCILILAFLLRIIYLGSKSFWLDEAVNVDLAEKNIFSWTNSLPPLYFAFLHFWLQIGKSETFVRFLSVIFGVLSVFAIYKIGIILYGEKEALISAFLLSISETAILFSQSVTYYSIFFPLSIVSVYFFLRMEENPSNKNKFLFLISIIMAFYAHYFTLLLLFVFIIFIIWNHKYNNWDIKKTKSLFLIIGISLIFIIPIFSLLTSQVIIKTAGSYIDFKSQTHLSINFLSEIFTYLILNEYYEQTVLVYIISGLLLYGFIITSNTYKKAKIFIILWILLPIAFAAVFTRLISNLQIRYISFVLPGMLLFTSHGIVVISEKIKTIMKNRIKLTINPIYFILITIILCSYTNLEYYYNSKNWDWKGTAEFLEITVENGSNIFIVPGYNKIPFNYYYKKNSTNIIEYSSFDDFIKLSRENNTYLVVTSEINSIAPDEFSRISIWAGMNMENKAIFSGGIKIFKNINMTNKAYVNNISILIPESFPPKVNVIVRGELKDNCTELKFNKQREDNNFIIPIYISRNESAECAMVPTPFDGVVTLDVAGLKTGKYTVIVNGVSSTFELEADDISAR